MTDIRHRLPTPHSTALWMTVADLLQRTVGRTSEFIYAQRTATQTWQDRRRARRHDAAVRRFQAASPEQQRRQLIVAMGRHDPHLLRDVLPD